MVSSRQRDVELSATVQAVPIVPCDPILKAVYEIVSTIGADILAKPCAHPPCGTQGCFEHSSGWKERIFPELKSRLTSQNVEAFFSPPKEFMLDFILLEAERNTTPGKRENQPKNIVRALLGLEMEWAVGVDDAGLEDDFNKLLCFNAALKAFIYCCNYHTNAKRRSNFAASIELRLQRFAERNASTQEQYLIVEYFKPTGMASMPTGRQVLIKNGIATGRSLR